MKAGRSRGLSITKHKRQYYQRMGSQFASSLISFWPLDDLTGTTARDTGGQSRTGTYSGVTLANADGPFGRKCPLFSVAGLSYVDLQTASLASAFNGAEGSIVIAGKVNDSSFWTDGLQHYATIFRADVNNQIILYKFSTNNQIRFTRTAGGNTQSFSLNGLTTTDWMVLGIEWSESGNYVRCYFNGVQVGADLTPGALWSGALATVRVGNYPALHYWSGWLSECSVYNAPLGALGQKRIADRICRALDLYGTGYKYISITGQSLSEGTNGGALLSSSQPFYNRKMSPAPIAKWFFPLDEVDFAGSLESPRSAIGNNLSYLDGTKTIIGKSGGAGKTYAQLKKGTQYFTDLITQATNAYQLGGSAVTFMGFTIIHGESDGALSMTAADYKLCLEEWQNDYQTDVNAAISGSSALPAVICQMSTGAPNVTNVLKQVTLGQYNTVKAHPGVFYLAGPKYQFTYIDAQHLTNSSYRALGEMHARVWRKIIAGQSWSPLWPVNVARTDNIVTITFNVPSGPLVFDTTTLPAVPNYGFEFYDSGGPSVTISNVAISGNDIVITLSGIPSGTGKLVRYAYTTQVAGRTGPWGNLRDSDNTGSYYGNSTYNWCVHFEETVP